jgi:hypothetical protein
MLLCRLDLAALPPLATRFTVIACHGSHGEKKEKDQRRNGERRERVPRKSYEILIFFI